MDFKRSQEAAEIEMSKLKDTIRSFHEECGELLKMEIDEDSLHRDQIVSRTALNQLTMSRIRALVLDEQNVGKFVLVRVLEEDYSRAECSRFNVVDDPDGNVIGLAHYNYPLDEVFVPGTVLIIKEPYRKDKKMLPFILCDCPTDILVLLPSHPWHPMAESTDWNNSINFMDPLAFDPAPRSSGEWRARGKELFEKNKLILAREAYFLGRKMCDKNYPIFEQILINQLEVNLNLGYYDWVIEEVKKLPNVREALFCKGKAHYMLRQFEDALSTFRNTIEIFKATGKLELERYKDQVDETRDMLKRAETRVKESKGEFSIEDIKNESKKNPFQEIDCADFCVPMKITEILGKGKSLILETEVKKRSGFNDR